MSERFYYMDDCVVAVPEGFVDRTTHVLEWSADDGSPIIFGAQRDRVPGPIAPGAPVPPFDFAAYVADQVKAYPAQFPGFRLERDELSRKGDVELRRRGFRWKKDQKVLYHLQVFVLSAPAILVLSSTATAKNRAQVDALIDATLENMQFRAE